MKKFGEPCVECIGFTICAPDIACNSQTCNFFRKALEGVQTQSGEAPNQLLKQAIAELEWTLKYLPEGVRTREVRTFVKEATARV